MFPVLKVEFNLLKLFPAFIPIIAYLWDNKGYCFYRKVLSKRAIIQFLLYSFAG